LQKLLLPGEELQTSYRNFASESSWSHVLAISSVTASTLPLCQALSTKRCWANGEKKTRPN